LHVDDNERGPPIIERQWNLILDFHDFLDFFVFGHRGPRFRFALLMTFSCSDGTFPEQLGDSVVVHTPRSECLFPQFTAAGTGVGRSSERAILAGQRKGSKCQFDKRCAMVEPQPSDPFQTTNPIWHDPVWSKVIAAGRMYMVGQGFNEDRDRAMKWFKSSRRAGG
jgi:hypothetical protein